MKKVLVIADTHRNTSAISVAMRRFKDVDAVIHLGDNATDIKYIKRMTDAPVYAVRGNCDVSSAQPDERVVVIGGVRILAMHGHKKRVKSGLLNLGMYALEQQVDIACFGHTHIPAEQLYEGVVLYNPGSLGEPRHLKPSVGVISIDNGRFKIKTHIIS